MTDPIRADVVYRGAYIITMDGDRRVFRNGHLAVRGADIVSVGPDSDWTGVAARTVNATRKVIMPGMVNAHNHVNQSIFRGWQDDKRAEGPMSAFAEFQVNLWRNAGEEHSYNAVRFHLLDMVRGGTTATHEQHFTNVPLNNIDGVLQAMDESGMRAFVSRCHINEPQMVPAIAHESVETVLKEVERLRKKFKNDRIEITSSPINPSWVKTPEELIELREGIRAMGVPFDIDLNGEAYKMTMAQRGFKGGAVAYCDSLGILDDQTLGGKSFMMELDEYEIWGKRGVKACMVPMGRLQRELGIALHHFLANGVVPGLGTDAPGSHPTTSLWEVMRLCITTTNTRKLAESRQGITQDHEQVATPELVLEMATLAGQRALFLDPRVGGLAAGNAADYLVLNIDHPTFYPTFDGRRLLNNIVHCAEASMVETVAVNGKVLVEGGKSTIWDEEQVIADAERSARLLYEKAGVSDYIVPRGAGDTFRGWKYV